MSSAVKKFQSRHPAQHQLLTSMFQSSKQRRKSVFACQTESDQLNCEWSNMIRNEELFKFRKEDDIFEEQKTFKPQGKRVSWSKNLLDIRTISPHATPPCYYNDKMLDQR